MERSPSAPCISFSSLQAPVSPPPLSLLPPLVISDDNLDSVMERLANGSSLIGSPGIIHSPYDDGADKRSENSKPSPFAPLTLSSVIAESCDSGEEIDVFKKYTPKKIAPDVLLRYQLDARAIILVQKVLRGWIQRRRLAAMRRRTEAMRELLNTEIGYVRSLELLVKHYVKPLRLSSTSVRAFIMPSQIDDIFSTIEDIKQANSLVLADLAKVMETWNYFSCVGSVMLLHVGQLQAHLPYIVNYERGHQILEVCMKHKDFTDFLQKRMTLAELDYKTLDDFLILPVQRIPRYIMLIEAIYKYTPVSHPDREPLKRAAHEMRLFAGNINRTKATKAKLLDCCNSIVGFPDAELYQDSRFVVREGLLYDEKKRARFCFLMSDLFIFCKVAKPSKKDLKGVKPHYKYVGHMQLDWSTIFQVHSSGSISNHTTPSPYVLTLKNNAIKHTFTTQPNEEGKGWSKDIHSVLAIHRKKSQTK